MSKFFRKYSRALLLVFMSVLLVIFLIPDTFSGRQGAGGALHLKIGEAFGQPIYTTDLERVRADLDLLRRLNVQPFPTNDPDEVSYYLSTFLLMEEAKHAGVEVGRQQVVESLSQLQIGPAEVDRIRVQFDRSADSVYAALQRYLAAIELWRLQMYAIEESSPRLAIAYRDMSQEAALKLSVLDARAFVPLVPEPTEDEIKAHFEQCKERPTGHTDDKLEFGYLLPNRVALEYVTVDPKAAELGVRVRDREAQRFYEDHKAQYTKRVPFPTTQPDGRQFDVVQQTYEEVAERVKADARTAKSIEESQRLVNLLQQEARRPWESSTRDAAGFLTPPPADKLINGEALRARHPDTPGLVIDRTVLMEAAQIRMFPGLGQAATTAGGTMIGTPDLAFRVPGLFAPAPDDASPRLALFEPSPVMISTTVNPTSRTREPYQGYFFFVTEIAPSAAPSSLDSIRDMVVQDLKVQRAFALAEQAAKRIAERAREVGLAAAVQQDEQLQSLLANTTSAPAVGPGAEQFAREIGPFVPSGRFVRQTMFAEHLGRTTKLAEAVFALDAASASAPAHRIAVVPAATSFKWGIAELETVQPLYSGDYAGIRDQLSQRMSFQPMMEFRQGWYDSDAIRRRANYAVFQEN